MEAVRRFAQEGRYVVGVCNGFQILTEAGLLPGALLANLNLHFTCKEVGCGWSAPTSPSPGFTGRARSSGFPSPTPRGATTPIPRTLARLEGEGLVVFRYAPLKGEGDYNPNGSLHDIAGIVNEKGNVLGMMPHPERAVDEVLGNTDGLPFFLDWTRRSRDETQSHHL
jgi:phosphoribosylformylglycinamidine (FGAM) synthase-like amidotransferase family enzyme